MPAPSRNSRTSKLDCASFILAWRYAAAGSMLWGWRKFWCPKVRSTLEYGLMTGTTLSRSASEACVEDAVMRRKRLRAETRVAANVHELAENSVALLSCGLYGTTSSASLA